LEAHIKLKVQGKRDERRRGGLARTRVQETCVRRKKVNGWRASTGPCGGPIERKSGPEGKKEEALNRTWREKP